MWVNYDFFPTEHKIHTLLEEKGDWTMIIITFVYPIILLNAFS